MALQRIGYEADGVALTGYLADGSRGRAAPGVLVAHEGPGVGVHEKERAERLAERGFVAFALDLYGEESPPLDRAKALVKELRADRVRLRRRTIAALDVLRAHPNVDRSRLAAVGFCFGGTAVLELARAGVDVACVVGFHPGLDAAPDVQVAVRAKILVCVGDRDPIVNAEQRAAFSEEMRRVGADWQMIVYGGVGHSFTNRHIDAHGLPGFAYDASADRRSWDAMLALFRESFGDV